MLEEAGQISEVLTFLDLPVEAAREKKWRIGQQHYGPVFVGHPIEQLYEEYLDSLNYIDEAERRGYDLGNMRQEIVALCERARDAYRRGPIS